MEISNQLLTLSVLASLWALPWKGLALWKAAKNGHKGWFVLILLVNTLAILEIIYLFWVEPRIKLTFKWNGK